MGSTCSSVHVLWRGPAAAVGTAVSRAYTKLGYQRVKKPPPDGGKHVILQARAGERYLSIYDSTNAALDTGELKDLALATSKALKTGAVFTSLYDSDTYEFIVFSNGRQVDLLMTEAVDYTGPMKRLGDKARVTQWGKIFGVALSVEAIKTAADPEATFANEPLARLCALIGLPGDRPQIQYSDFADEPAGLVTELYFARKPEPQPVVAAGEVSLRNYFDPDNSRKLLVYPASWPMPVDKQEMLTWLVLSEGAGFSGGSARVEVTGPPGLVLSRGFMNGAKFHNGQIVGGLELPPTATREEGLAYLETKRFALTPTGPAVVGTQAYHAEYPNLRIPAMTPERTTQILIVIQFDVVASVPGEWQVKVTLNPQSNPPYQFDLPPAGVAAGHQSWLPVVSGLHPRTAYSTDDIPEPTPPDSVLDQIVKSRLYSWQCYDRSAGITTTELSAPAARARLLSEWETMVEHQHKSWRGDIAYQHKRALQERRLDHGSVASNVAVLRHDGAATLEACRGYLEDWLRPLIGGPPGTLRILADKKMSDKGNFGKLKTTLPFSAIGADKVWNKLFDVTGNYQSVIIDILPDGVEIPIGGAGFQTSLLQDGKLSNEEWREQEQAQLMRTLSKMRGRAFDVQELTGTVHLFNWVINHPRGHACCQSSPSDLKAALDAFCLTHPPLQAWHGQSTWIPLFDRAGGYHKTVYEDMSILNYFRGVLFRFHEGLHDRKMTAPWCANVLRMVTPHMWLGPSLFAQLDRPALERVAVVTAGNGSTKIEKRPDCAMDALELALLPILPIESARTTVLPST